MKKLKEVLMEGRALLKEANIDNYEYDSVMLMEYVFHISHMEYFMNPEKEVDETEYLKCIHDRMNHYPLQYITHEQWFMGMPFKVNENVLIPRQDTEILVENAIKTIGKRKCRVLDLCTGSGCIAVSISRFCENAEVTGADISGEALKIAEYNNKANHTNVEFIQSNLFENITGKFDVIVSNPPYIPTDDIKELMQEVRQYEPRMALDGDKDGLVFYKKITGNAVNYLTKDGYLLYEIGCSQADDVSRIMRENRFTGIEVVKDLASLDRVVIGMRKEENNV